MRKRKKKLPCCPIFSNTKRAERGKDTQYLKNSIKSRISSQLIKTK
jgi:hypothetical protein